MIDLQLFLGVERDERIEHLLSSTPLPLKELLLSGGDYLSQVEHEEKTYIGKFLPNKTRVKDLEGVENHLTSLLQKMMPLYSPSKHTRPSILTLSHVTSCH